MHKISEIKTHFESLTVGIHHVYVGIYTLGSVKIAKIRQKKRKHEDGFQKQFVELRRMFTSPRKGFEPTVSTYDSVTSKFMYADKQIGLDVLVISWDKKYKCTSAIEATYLIDFINPFRL